jgi:hypothetical protein
VHISAVQVAAMNKYSEEAFLRRVMEFVVEMDGDEADNPELRPQCEALIQEAREFGFSTELEVATFAVCGFTYGPDFHSDTDLPFRHILSDPRMDFATKAGKMVEVLEAPEEDAETDD